MKKSHGENRKLSNYPRKQYNVIIFGFFLLH